MKRTYILLLFLVFRFSGFAQTPTIGLIQNDSLSQNGYTLFSNSKHTYLIDNCGFVVQSWESEYWPGISAYLLENGNLLRTGRIEGAFLGGGLGGKIELFDWDNNLLWSYDYADENVHQHHDIEPLPNGNFLLIAWEARTLEEAIAAGRDTSNIGENGIWSEQVVEVEMVGTNGINIVWEWHLWDHLIQEFDDSKENYGLVTDHPELMDVNVSENNIFSNSDWMHLNSIDYNPELDQILLSSRLLSEIWIIDHSTTTEEAAGHTGGNSGKGGDLLYRWGNPRIYQQGDSTDQQFYGQHDARWIPAGYPNEGMLMVFNNGAGRPEGFFSTVERWTAPTDANGQYILESDQAFGPEIPEWIYANDTFYSVRLSGAQPLDNGNILVCEGRPGRFFELTPDDSIVWEYVNPLVNGIPSTQGSNPIGNSIFRATRYRYDYPAFMDKDLSPGDPIELEPYESDCMIFGPMMTSNQDLNELNMVSIQANPFSAELKINNETEATIFIEIVNLAGVVYENRNTNNGGILIATHDWPQGLYVVRIFNSEKNKRFIQKVVKI